MAELTVLLIAAVYLIGWVATTAICGPSMAEKPRHYMDSGDYALSTLMSMFWPVYTIALPFLLVGWVASKIGERL